MYNTFDTFVVSNLLTCVGDCLLYRFFPLPHIICCMRYEIYYAPDFLPFLFQYNLHFFKILFLYLCYYLCNLALVYITGDRSNMHDKNDTFNLNRAYTTSIHRVYDIHVWLLAKTWLLHQRLDPSWSLAKL